MKRQGTNRKKISVEDIPDKNDGGEFKYVIFYVL
jgi:hypothetical protein